MEEATPEWQSLKNEADNWNQSLCWSSEEPHHETRKAESSCWHFYLSEWELNVLQHCTSSATSLKHTWSLLWKSKGGKECFRDSTKLSEIERKGYSLHFCWICRGIKNRVFPMTVSSLQFFHSAAQNWHCQLCLCFLKLLGNQPKLYNKRVRTTAKGEIRARLHFVGIYLIHLSDLSTLWMLSFTGGSSWSPDSRSSCITLICRGFSVSEKSPQGKANQP